MKTTAKSIFFVLTLILSLASPAFALDATQAVRTNVTPKSPIPTGTVATWAMDAAVPPGWLACNGQTVPASYPELRALMSSVPNYNNQQFLRGSTNGAGRAVADSTRSHTHGQPSHSHGFSMALSSTSVTGKAAAQRFQDRHTAINGSSSNVVDWPGAGAVEIVRDVYVGGPDVTFSFSNGFAVGDATYHDTEGPSSVSGNVVNGTVSGTIYQSGADETYATGGTETAPQHVLVKFIIKAD